MSSGPGKLQRRILGVLNSARSGLLSYRELSERFPEEARHGNLNPAVKGLAKQGRVVDEYIGNARLIGLVYEPGEELVALVQQTQGAAHALARARRPPQGAPSGPLTEEGLQRARSELNRRKRGGANK